MVKKTLLCSLFALGLLYSGTSIKAVEWLKEATKKINTLPELSNRELVRLTLEPMVKNWEKIHVEKYKVLNKKITRLLREKEWLLGTIKRLGELGRKNMYSKKCKGCFLKIQKSHKEAFNDAVQGKVTYPDWKD